MMIMAWKCSGTSKLAVTTQVRWAIVLLIQREGSSWSFILVVRATLPPSMLFADRALLRRGYSISEPNALVETVSKYKGLH